MKTTLVWLLVVLLITFCSAEEQDCECVPYFRCLNGRINDNGADIIDVRFINKRHSRLSLGNSLPKNIKPCESIYDICCLPPERKPSEETTNEPLVKRKECEQSKRHNISFSVDNDKTHSGEFPWTVAILKTDSSYESDVYQCGGTLIHPQIVLTAAHCLGNVQSNILKIQVGKWTTSNETSPHTSYNVKNVIVHEKYDEHTLFNDFALIILSQPVEFSTENVNIVYLPETNENFDHSPCFANGWGKKELADEDIAAFKRIELPIVPSDQCQRALATGRLGNYFNLHKSFICAGGEPGKDTCKSDGGHPLICPMKNKPQRFVQVGIVSWGIGCGEDKIPGVYANVATARNWIDRKVKEAGFDLHEYQCTQ